MLTPVRCRLRTRASFARMSKKPSGVSEASAGADSVPMVMPETVWPWPSNVPAKEWIGVQSPFRGMSASSATY